MTTTIRQTKDGRLAVISPYHPTLVEEMHRLMGRFGNLTLPDGTSEQAWFVRAEHREKVEKLLADLWPPEDQKVERTYRFESGDTFRRSAPTIDGLDLVSFNRDWVSRVKHPDVVEVIEYRLTSGGSRNHPSLSGTLVVRARVRPGAKAQWGSDPAETLTADDSSTTEVPALFRDAFEEKGE